MQGMPDCQQHTLGVFPPLAIPKSQLLNALPGQPLLPFAVMQYLVRQAMLKTIQLHGEPRESAVKVQKIFPRIMLTAEFESGKSSGA